MWMVKVLVYVCACVCVFKAETYIAGKGILQLSDRVGYRHWRGAGGQAEVRVLGADAELDGRHGQHVVHVDVHAVDGRDGALQALHRLGALALLQRALVTDGARLVLLALLWTRV